MTKPTSELASYLLNKDQTGTSTTRGGKPGVWFHTRFWARSVPVQSVHVTHLPGTSIAYSAPGPSSQYPTSPHEIRHLTKTLLRRPDGNSKSWWNAMIILVHLLLIHALWKNTAVFSLPYFLKPFTEVGFQLALKFHPEHTHRVPISRFVHQNHAAPRPVHTCWALLAHGPNLVRSPTPNQHACPFLQCSDDAWVMKQIGLQN